MALSTDVFLVALDDRGRARAEGGVDVVLAGALLIGDLFDGRSMRDLTGLDDPVEAVGSRARGLAAIVAAQAVAAGVVAEEERRVLGLVPRRRLRVADTVRRDGLVDRIRAALVPGARPDAEDAAFAVLCAVSGIARRWVPPPATPEGRAGVAAQVNALCELAGENATVVIRAVRTQYGRRDAEARAADGATVPLVVLLPVDGSDDYGDTSSDGSGAGDGSDGGAGDGGGGGGGGD